jgi:hypothetical protein
MGLALRQCHSEADCHAAIRRAGSANAEVLRRIEPYEKCGVMVRSFTIRGIR